MTEEIIRYGSCVEGLVLIAFFLFVLLIFFILIARYSTVGKVSACVVLALFIVDFLLALIVMDDIRVNPSLLIPAEHNDESVYATAYYVIEYKNSEEVTLTVFIKNDSDKTLKSATVEEQKSSKTARVEAIKPKEEKMVNLIVNPLKDEESYKFELLNMEFEE